MIEQDRIAASKVQAEAIAATKRAADQAHRERVHQEIMDDMMMAREGATDPLVHAARITIAIAAGRIRHLTINY